jgi:hypothetical protein
VEGVDAHENRQQESGVSQRLKKNIRQIRAQRADEIGWALGKLRIRADVERWIVRIERNETEAEKDGDRENQEANKFIETAVISRDQAGCECS